jgi:hypothetical protein
MVKLVSSSVLNTSEVALSMTTASLVPVTLSATVASELAFESSAAV